MIYTESKIDGMTRAQAQDAVRNIQYLLLEATGGNGPNAERQLMDFFGAAWSGGVRWVIRGRSLKSSSWVSIRPLQAKIAVGLLNGISKRMALYTRVYSEELLNGVEPATAKSIDINVCQLRPVFGAFGLEIHSQHGVGYHIDAAQRNKLNSVIAEWGRASDFDFTPWVKNNSIAATPEKKEGINGYAKQR